MQDVITAIGPKIRQLRKQKDLSLQQLAERSGVSAATIHKIERNGMVPTVTTLMKIAGALNRSVAYFVDEQEEAKPVVYTAASEKRAVFTSKQGLDLRGITGPYGLFFMAGAIATVEPGAISGAKPMEHPGEELVLVLSGSLVFEIEGEQYILEEGDALHFRTDRPHRWANPTDKRAQAAWMALRSN
ncbi:MAG TPA: cupin domain-containing protein [Actinomycetota bacterium]|nr:cupin domain-containing protein [Actinomycetota bacterium]